MEHVVGEWCYLRNKPMYELIRSRFYWHKFRHAKHKVSQAASEIILNYKVCPPWLQQCLVMENVDCKSIKCLLGTSTELADLYHYIYLLFKLFIKRASFDRDFQEELARLDMVDELKIHLNFNLFDKDTQCFSLHRVLQFIKIQKLLYGHIIEGGLFKAKFLNCLHPKYHGWELNNRARQSALSEAICGEWHDLDISRHLNACITIYIPKYMVTQEEKYGYLFDFLKDVEYYMAQDISSLKLPKHVEAEYVAKFQGHQIPLPLGDVPIGFKVGNVISARLDRIAPGTKYVFPEDLSPLHKKIQAQKVAALRENYFTFLKASKVGSI